MDVYTTAIGMKKGRPGITLSALAAAGDVEKLETILFQETTTLGIRRISVTRRSLPRETANVETPWGRVAGKVATLPAGSRRFSPEYEACRELATTHNKPLSAVYTAAQQAFRS